MRVAICDDNPEELENVRKLVVEYFNSHSLELSIDTFSEGQVLLNKVTYFPEDTDYDIYFLDILMPFNGISLSKALKEVNRKGVIIFTTNSNEYAIDAFSVDAKDYLLKPIDKEKLFARLDKVMDELTDVTEQNFVMKNEYHEYDTINIQDIAYIESYNRRMVIYLDNGEKYVTPVLRAPFLKEIPFDIEKHHFIQSHTSYVVNLNKVKSVKEDSFILKNGYEVPISKRSNKRVKAYYIKYLLGEQ